MSDVANGGLHERYERLRRTAGLFLAPVAFVLLLVAPLGLEGGARRLAAVFGMVIVLWVTEAIPLAATALLGPALAVVLGVAPAREAFAPFGRPIIFLFLGSFLVAEAMREHGLDRRIALFVLSRDWVGESPGRILFAFGAIAAFLSMWMSNTATTAMMLPIGLGVLATLSQSGAGSGARRSGYATGLMLMIAYSCNVGGIATPVGTPPNLIAIGQLEEILGRRISFFGWMSFALPIAVGLFLLVYFVIRRLFPPPVPTFAGASERIRIERAALGPWGAGEKASLAAFLLVVTLWVLPGLVALALGPEHPASRALEETLPEGPVALLGAALLFALPVDWPARRFALEWQQATRIDWGTILLFGGGLSLGSLAFSTGLAEALGSGALRSAGAMAPWALALVGLFVANLMTELMSNTATANLLVPMFLALEGSAAETAPLPAFAVAVGCSLAFCFPVATPPNAIVYGSGHVPMTQMIRAGVLLDVGCGLLAWAGLVLLL